MPCARSRHTLPLLALLAALVPIPGRAEPFAIIDKEGFGAAITAYTLDLPPGWQAQGRIAWTKPCSGNELYETILTATSPDGQSGLRMMPGHQVQWSDTSVDGTVDPALGQMAVAQAEATRNDMRTAFRNSNCQVGQVTGIDQILRVLILPKRPAGVQVVSTRTNDPLMALYKAGFGTPQPGITLRYDAQIIDLAYPGASGPMVERLWLSWYQFGDDPQANYMAGMPGFHFQNTYIDTITFAYAPAARAADLDAAAAAVASVKADTGWTAQVRAVQERINKDRERERKARGEAADLQHQQFIDWIRQ